MLGRSNDEYGNEYLLLLALLLVAALLVIFVACGENGAKCSTHDDCPDGSVCLFSRKSCASLCESDADCRNQETCHACATSSCPYCRDCIPACVE